MKTVLLRGPFLTMSGYGVHARQIAKWVLSKPNVDVKVMPLPWGNTPWFLDRNACDGLVGQLMDRSLPTQQRVDVSLQLQLPNEWDPSLALHNVGLTAGVETDKCNPAWVDACNRMSSVILPTSFVANTLKTSGDLRVPCHVVGESYNEKIDEEVTCDTLPTFSTNFNFLVFGQITGNNPANDRKNIFNTVKYMCDVFANDPDVGVVLKINAGRDTVMDRNTVHDLVKKVLSEVRKGPYPRVHVLHGRLSDAENAAFFKHPQIKALVTLTRGEGFGLPILDAAASGLPVIATDWSGHLDFLRLGKFIPVTCALTPVHPTRIDNEIFVNGARWAEVNELDFKKRVKKFRDYPTTPQEWARDSVRPIKERYSFKAVSQQYDVVLGDLLK